MVPAWQIGPGSFRSRIQVESAVQLISDCSKSDTRLVTGHSKSMMRLLGTSGRRKPPLQVTKSDDLPLQFICRVVVK